jgi:hypothetical protein
MTDECPETEYNIAVNISQVEWKIIQQMRFLKANRFGKLFLQYQDGFIVDCQRTLTDDPAQLKKIQLSGIPQKQGNAGEG